MNIGTTTTTTRTTTTTTTTTPHCTTRESGQVIMMFFVVLIMNYPGKRPQTVFKRPFMKLFKDGGSPKITMIVRPRTIVNRTKERWSWDHGPDRTCVYRTIVQIAPFFSSCKSRKWKRSRSRGPLSATTNYMAPRWCMAARATGMIGAWASTRSARASNTAASRSDMRPGPYCISNVAQTAPPHRCLRCANHALRNLLGFRTVTSFDWYHACCHSLKTSPKTSGASSCGKRDSAPCSCSSLCLRTHKGRSNMRMTAITGGSSPCWDAFVGSKSRLKTASRIVRTCGCTSEYR